MQRITIIKIRTPKTTELNKELQWIGTSLGLFNLRDKDKSCFRIFIEILKAAKGGGVLTSDDLARKLKLSRGTVVHHLHKLEETGIILHENKGYMLRVNNLSALIDELKNDVQRTCDQLKTIAENIDRKLGLE